MVKLRAITLGGNMIERRTLHPHDILVLTSPTGECFLDPHDPLWQDLQIAGCICLRPGQTLDTISKEDLQVFRDAVECETPSDE